MTQLLLSSSLLVNKEIRDKLISEDVILLCFKQGSIFLGPSSTETLSTKVECL